MKNKFLKITVSTLIVFFSLYICMSFIATTEYSLRPFFVQAAETVSEDAINEHLKTTYPDAYFPFKDLDNKIKGYDNIDHINKLNFTQKQSLYAYTITTSTLGTSITYLVIFDAQGYIQNIVFFNGTSSFFYNTFYTENGLVETLIGSKAPHLDSARFTNEMISSNYIKKGVKSAAENLVYEVLN